MNAPQPPRDPIAGANGYVTQPWLQWLTSFRIFTQNLTTPSGSVTAFAGSVAPQGWLLMQGQTVARRDYPALSAIFGGAGETFTLPDARGRFLVGSGDFALLSTGGALQRTLTQANLPDVALPVTDLGHAHTSPPHTHAITDPGHAHGGAGGALFVMAGGSGNAPPSPPGWSTAATTGTATTGITVGSTAATIDSATTGVTVRTGGTGAPVNTTPAYLAVNWIIKT